MTEAKMSLAQVSKELRRLASDGMFGIMADAIDAHVASQSTNPYERAVIEQAMVTECVNIEGRAPTDIIRDIISWHVDMDRSARNAEQPRGEPVAWIDHTDIGVILRTLGACRALEDLAHGTKLYTHPAPSQAVGAVDVDAERMAFEADIRSGIFSDNAADHHLRRNKHGVYEVEEVEYQWDGWLSHANVVPRPAVATAGDGVTDEVINDLRKCGAEHREIANHYNKGGYLNQYEIVKKHVSFYLAIDKAIAALASPSAPRVGVPEDTAKDAARYQWLKACNGGPIGIVAWHRDEEQEMVLVEERADAAIDKAMLAAAPEVGRG